MGDTLDLTGDTYTQLAGYTANPNNATSYVVVAAPTQTVSLYFAPQAVQLTVNYKSYKGASLLASKVIANVLQGSTYAIAAPSITGYTPDETVTNVVIKGVNQEVTLLYTPEFRDYVVNYVDAAGNAVHTSDQLTLAYDSQQTITALDIDGYQLASGQAATHTINFAADQGTHTFTYAVANKIVTRTIEFVDDAGNEPLPAVPQTVTLTTDSDGTWTTGSWPQYRTPSIAGKAADVVNVPDATVDANTADQTVTVTYHDVQLGAGIQRRSFTRTVEFVDAAGKAVAKPVTQEAQVSRTGTGAWSSAEFAAVAAPTIAGMVPEQKMVAKETVTADSKNSIVKILYRQVEAGSGIHDYSKTVTRTVNFVDAQGKTVAPSVTQSGTISKRNDGVWSSASLDAVPAPYVQGMVPKQTTVAATAIIDASGDSVINVVYNAAQVDAGIRDYRKTVTRTVNFVNANGKTVAPSVTQSGSITKRNDGAWSSARLDAVPAPYLQDMAPGQATVAATAITAQSSDSVINVVYHPVQVGTGIRDYSKTITRTIKFVDPSGRELKQALVQSVTLKRTDVDTQQGAWSTGVWAMVPAPVLAHYTANTQLVAAQLVTSAMSNTSVTLVYTSQTSQPGGSGQTQPGGNTGTDVQPGGSGQTQPGGNTGIDVQPGGSGQTQPGAGIGTDVQPGDSEQTLPNTDNTGTAGKPSVSGQTQNTTNTGTVAQPDDARQSLPNTANTLTNKLATGAQVSLHTQKQYKIVAAGANAIKRGSELPQTGDALDKPGSLLGVLGLALSGLAARVFVRKHKED